VVLRQPGQRSDRHSTSKFHDTLAASFNGSDVTGDLTMNGTKYAFTAAAVAAPAGMYTADLDGARASWIVRPDGSVTGVQFNGGNQRAATSSRPNYNSSTPRSSRPQVRNKRILQQADQSVTLQNGTLIRRSTAATSPQGRDGHHAVRLAELWCRPCRATVSTTARRALPFASARVKPW